MYRGKNKVQNPYTIQDTYKEYIKMYPIGSIYYLTYKEYLIITTEYLKYITQQLVEKSATVVLPFRLGSLSVIKYKPEYKSLRNMSIDWVKSKQLNKQVRLFNEHSNGYRYKFNWNRSRVILNNKTVYIFQAARSLKRRVAKLVKTKQNDYFER